MIEIHDTADFRSDTKSVVTLGKFDGLHLGHQKLVREVLRLQDMGYFGIAFTIAPETGQTLLTAEEKRDKLESFGIDCMIRCPYVPRILSMSPEQFVSKILVEQLKAKHIIVGTDFRFGYKRSGDARLLQQLQGKYGFRVTVMEKECWQGREISSTYVREALGQADVELAARLLGYAYAVEGTVQHGRRLGRTIGMPTINLIPDPHKLLPPFGVYFSETECGELRWQGVTNIGQKPTVDGSFTGVETYLYGVDEELYGRKVKVSLRSFRRPERRFSSLDELKSQMEQDVQAGKDYFGIR